MHLVWFCFTETDRLMHILCIMKMPICVSLPERGHVSVAVHYVESVFKMVIWCSFRKLLSQEHTLRCAHQTLAAYRHSTYSKSKLFTLAIDERCQIITFTLLAMWYCFISCGRWQCVSFNLRHFCGVVFFMTILLMQWRSCICNSQQQQQQQQQL